MTKRLSRLLLTIGLLLCNMALFAQGNPEDFDTMRGSGKIYVVVAVCLTILAGLILYVFLLDRKISRLEKNKD